MGNPGSRGRVAQPKAADVLAEHFARLKARQQAAKNKVAKWNNGNDGDDEKGAKAGKGGREMHGGRSNGPKVAKPSSREVAVASESKFSKLRGFRFKDLPEKVRVKILGYVWDAVRQRDESNRLYLSHAGLHRHLTRYVQSQSPSGAPCTKKLHIYNFELLFTSKAFLKAGITAVFSSAVLQVDFHFKLYNRQDELGPHYKTAAALSKRAFAPYVKRVVVNMIFPSKPARRDHRNFFPSRYSYSQITKSAKALKNFEQLEHVIVILDMKEELEEDIAFIRAFYQLGSSEDTTGTPWDVIFKLPGGMTPIPEKWQQKLDEKNKDIRSRMSRHDMGIRRRAQELSEDFAELAVEPHPRATPVCRSFQTTTGVYHTDEKLDSSGESIATANTQDTEEGTSGEAKAVVKESELARKQRLAKERGTVVVR